MDQFVEGKNPYTILGLEKGQKSTPDDIKKAYRRLALIKHPDKAKSKPNAAQEFDELQKAYAILSDKSARGALDDYLEAQSAREARLAKQDAKRQRLREELERKEKEGVAAKSEEEQARARLKVELEALRMRAVEKQHQQQQVVAEAAAAKQAARAAADGAAAAGGGAGAAGGADTDDETTQLLLRTIKVVWDPTISSYTTERLRDIFSAGWAVEDVILKDSSKKKKASALVVLSSIHAAQQAAQEVHGDLQNPLLVTPYLKVMPHTPQQQQQQQQQSSTQQQEQQPVALGAKAGKQPLFAAMSSPVHRPAPRPGKPLFPGAAAVQLDKTAPGATGTGYGSFSSFPAAGFPTSFPAGVAPAGRSAQQVQQPPASGTPASSKFSSFPGSAGGTSVPVGGQFEDSVLEKLQQKASKNG